MGCTGSSEKPKAFQSGKQDVDNSALFLMSVIPAAEAFIDALPDSEAVKNLVMLTYVNSCVEVMRVHFRTKMGVAKNSIQKVCKESHLQRVPRILESLEERAVDEGFYRLLHAWVQYNGTFKKVVSPEVGLLVVSTALAREKLNKPATIGDLMALHLEGCTSVPALVELFQKLSGGADMMPAESMVDFIHTAQQQENMSERMILEKIKYRFGGAVQKYNFSGYLGSRLTNNILDPHRASNVWQDMTQPLPHYTIDTVQINSVDDLHRSLRGGSRALVLRLHFGVDGKTVFSGSLHVEEMLDIIKNTAFTTNQYPVILSLDPRLNLSIDVQNAFASILKEKLGDMLATGIMFEGGTQTDPKFSPASQQNKVLLMGPQAPLCPFIGFFVADMNRDGLGVRVTNVHASSAAHKAGIAKDDWLTHINGTAIQNKQHLKTILNGLAVGSEFTMKRENMDGIRLVVGGRVGELSWPMVSKALSELVFLKFNTVQSTPLAPWDVVCVDPIDVERQKFQRQDLFNHFMYLNLTDEKGSAVAGLAAVQGIQFMVADEVRTIHSWSHGYFSYNGHCGYILKDEVQDSLFKATITVIAGPRSTLGAPLLRGKASVHSAGMVQCKGNGFTFVHCNDESVAVLELSFRLPDGSEVEYLASIPPLLMRGGYRTLPVISKSEEFDIHPMYQGVLCYVNVEKKGK